MRIDIKRIDSKDVRGYAFRNDVVNKFVVNEPVEPKRAKIEEEEKIK
jgi:hypothetical protein